ncbi:MAG TPA: response regulator transcription factor [Acidobacteriaceae bacterium]|jgi:DNA-binding response OmpR family regulator
MDKIVVVEDDPKIQRILHRLFVSEGFEVLPALDGQTAIELANSRAPSAIILDLMLPDTSGRDVCRTIKATSPGIPVIIVSGLSEVADKVLLFDIGADDYMTKPFSPRELLARVQVAIRRVKKPEVTKAVSFGDIVIDLYKMEFSRSGAPLYLTAHEFKLLRFLIENAGRVLTREELLQKVWKYSTYITTRTVDNHILKLRQKVEPDPTNPLHIRTVHGLGYKFIY